MEIDRNSVAVGSHCVASLFGDWTQTGKRSKFKKVPKNRGERMRRKTKILDTQKEDRNSANRNSSY